MRVLRDMLCAFSDRTMEYLDEKRDYFKVILTFLQICTQHLSGVIQVDWPPFYKTMMRKLDFVNLNFLS